jgi:phosphoribosylformylglycinamidine (FGAM) synthase PurS component
MNEIERVQVKAYTGTLESLKEMIIDLKLQDDEYHFNAINGEIRIRQYGDVIQFKIGDCYHFKIEEEQNE